MRMEAWGSHPKTNALPIVDFRQPRSVSREKLRAARASEVQQSLLTFFDRIDTPGAQDFDDILKVGLLLQENPSGSEGLAIDWLAANVSATRLDIVCAFLVGLWTFSPRVAPPSREEVFRLASLRPAERTNPDADYSYALAMARVLESGAPIETATIALQQLEVAAARGTGDSSLDQSLFSLRNRHRKLAAGAAGSELRGSYRAYAVTGAEFAFVVERANSNEEVVQILGISELPGELKVEYRKCDPRLSNILAVDAIQMMLLEGFFQREHSSRVSRDHYVDVEDGFKVTADY